MTQINPTPSKLRTDKRWLFALACIVLLGVVLRLQNIDYGLPLFLNEDEPTYYFRSMTFGFGDFNPHYFKKPTFFLYFYFAFYYVVYLFSGMGSWQQFFDNFWQHPEIIVTVGRSVTVVFAAVSIMLLAYLGKRLHSVWVGLLAALMLAIDPTHVRYSPIVISDIPVLCMMLLTSIMALNVFEKGRLKDYLLCGFSIALVISFKYNFFIGIALPAAHFLRVWVHAKPLMLRERLTKTIADSLQDRKFWLGLCLIPVVVVCLSPYLLLNFSEFWADFNLEKKHMLYRNIRAENPQLELFGAFGKIFFKVIPRAIGWPLYIAGLLGWASVWKLANNKKHWLIILAFPLVFLLALQQFQISNAKYLMPLYPFWFLLASIVLVSFYQHFVGANRVKQLVYTACVFCILGFSAFKTVDYFQLYSHLDTRQVARQWVLNTMQDDETVLAEYNTFQLKNHRWTGRAHVGVKTYGSFAQVKEVLVQKTKVNDLPKTDYWVLPLRNHYKHKTYSAEYFASIQQYYQPLALVHPGHAQRVITPLDEKTPLYTNLYTVFDEKYPKDKTPGPAILILKKR